MCELLKELQIQDSWVSMDERAVSHCFTSDLETVVNTLTVFPWTQHKYPDVSTCVIF